MATVEPAPELERSVYEAEEAANKVVPAELSAPPEFL